MPNWKKLIISGSDAALNSLEITSHLAVTGSANILGNAEITGSLEVTGAVTASALDVAGKIALNDGGNSVFIGTNAGRIDDAGDNNNVGIGQNSLYTNVDGEYNVAVGLESLYSNTDGYDNTAIGAWALYTNSIGYSNTAIGLEALNSNTNGHSNSALGKNALSANSTGDANVAVGIDAMRFGGTAVHQNTALGGFALRSNTGQGNTSIGHGSLYHKVTGDTNVAIGTDAGRVLADKGSSATTINDSIFIGYRTSPLANSQTNQIVIGHDATGLGSNTIVLGNDSITTTALTGNVGIGTTTPAEKLTVEGNISGSGNVNILGDVTASAFVGDGSALTNITAEWDGSHNGNAEITGSLEVTGAVTASALDVAGKIALNDGGNSVFIGTNAGLNDDASANNNTGVGYEALKSNTIGQSNIAIGTDALRDNTTGSNNTANGGRALQNNTGGSANVAIGHIAMLNNISGYSNVAIGYQALANLNLYRGNNVVIGNNAGQSDTTNSPATNVSQCTLIGASAKTLAAFSINQIVIGYNASGIGSNTVVLGNDSITTTALKGNVGIGTTTPTAKLQVKGSGTTSATTALLIEDSAGTDLLKVTDEGNVGIGTTSPLGPIHIVRELNNPNDNLWLGMENSGAGGYADWSFWKKGANGFSLRTSSAGFGGTTNPIMNWTNDGKIALNTDDTPTANLMILSGDNAVDGTFALGVSSLRRWVMSAKAQSANTTWYYDLDIRPALVGGWSGNFLINGTNVGIGTTTPTAKLQVKGAGTTSATTALLIEDSAGTDLLKVRDDGIISIGTTTSNGTLTVSSTGTSTHTATFYSITGQTVNNTEWIVANVPVTTINAAGELAMAQGMMRFNNKQNAFDNSGNLGSIYVTDDDASYPFSSVGNLILQSRGNSSRGIGFVTGNTGNLRMFLSGGGNLGIGLTADATEKLHVSGNAIVTGTMDVQGGFADDLTVSGLTPKLVINNTEGTVFDGDYFGILEWKMNDGNTGGVTATGNIQMQFNDNTSGGPAQGAVGEGADMIFNTGKVAVTGQGQVMNEGMRLTKDGAVKITQSLNVGVTTDYLDNAAAITGGLVVGDIYRTGDILKIVH